jgi:hypothetical protein
VIGVSITRLGPELVEQALRHLVGALILRDFLAHHEHALVAAHLLRHRVAQRFATVSFCMAVPAGTSGSAAWRLTSCAVPVSAFCASARSLGLLVGGRLRRSGGGRGS